MRDSETAARRSARSSRALLRITGSIGAFLIGTLARVSLTAGVLVAASWRGLWPGTWRRTVRREFVRQCWQIGVSGLPTTVVIAMIVGIALVFQTMYWLSIFGDLFKINQVILGALVRELAPLLVALIVIGRSITVMIVRLDELKRNGQVRMLDAQGVDSFDYLVMPRIAALATCMFPLSVTFVATTLVTGYLASRAAGIIELSLFEFLAGVANILDLKDFILFVFKSVVLGALIGAVTCVTVLASPPRRLDASELLPRGYMRALLATFIASAALTLLVAA